MMRHMMKFLNIQSLPIVVITTALLGLSLIIFDAYSTRQAELQQQQIIANCIKDSPDKSELCLMINTDKR